MNMKVFGTVTSPFVRRVRAVAHELHLDTTLVDTATDAGQAALRELTPIWKVPAVVVEGVPIFDSAVITRHLLQAHGPEPMAPWTDEVHTQNLVTVIDDALDALINVFYLAKDGVSPAAASYVQKQSDRAASGLSWLADRLPESWLDARASFGLPALALYTAVDWMRFRSTYDIDQHPALRAFRETHAQRPSLVATAPDAK